MNIYIYITVRFCILYIYNIKIGLFICLKLVYYCYINDNQLIYNYNDIQYNIHNRVFYVIYNITFQI